MTNYADLVDEKSTGSSRVPQNFKTNLPGKVKREQKPVRPLLDIRNSRMDEINKGLDLKGGANSHANKIIGHDPSRTLQPSRQIVNLDLLQEEAKKYEEEEKKQEKEKGADKSKTVAKI